MSSNISTRIDGLIRYVSSQLKECAEQQVKQSEAEKVEEIASLRQQVAGLQAQVRKLDE